jgi:hypothetical protein
MIGRFRVSAAAATLLFLLGSGGARAANAFPSACSLISLATAKAIYGQPLSAGVEYDGNEVQQPFVCSFPNAARNAVPVYLELYDAKANLASITPQQFEFYVTTMKDPYVKTQHVSGVGEDALYAEINGQSEGGEIWVLSNVSAPLSLPGEDDGINAVVLHIRVVSPPNDAQKAALIAAANAAVTAVKVF